MSYIPWLGILSHRKITRSGGKNAFLGKLTSVLTDKGGRVPSGAAVTHKMLSPRAQP